jgi:peptidylprolyl isomerase
MIHIIGDSHAFFMFQTIEKCVIHHIGAVTMHRIGRDGINIKNYGITDNEFVVFVLGEIDARCHIGIQRDKYHRNDEEIINALVKNYLQSILDNKQQFMNIHFIVCSVVPPTNAHYNPEFPFYGTLEDRIFLTKQLNRNLKNKCELSDIGFLDIYDYYSLENGELNPAISDGLVHIRSDCNEEIKKDLFDYINNHNLNGNYLKKKGKVFIQEYNRKVRFNDTVKVHFTCKLEDGTLLDTSIDSNPVQFTIGKDEAIPGIERNIIGMHPGESKMFKVLPDKAFGYYRNELIFEINRKELPVNFKPEIRQRFQIGEGNDARIVKVINVSESSLTVDANLPLAGKELLFEIHLIGIE